MFKFSFFHITGYLLYIIMNCPIQSSVLASMISIVALPCLALPCLEVFTARQSAVLAMIDSVCLTVCLTHAGIMPKRLKL